MGDWAGLAPFAYSVVTGLVTAVVTVAVNKIEIKHLWLAIQRHENVHRDIWKEVGRVKSERGN